MSRLIDEAVAHQEARTELMHAASARAVASWRVGSPTDLDTSWDALAPGMVKAVTRAQVTAARQAEPYLASVNADGARLVPEAFGGLMLDGREVGPAMFGAVVTTKQLIGKGMAPVRAFEAGAAFLATIVGAAIQDIGRQADMTGAASAGFTHYVRVVNPGACSRCAILAGSDRFSRPFLRHPRCKCTQLPVKDGQAPAGRFTSPDDYFDSLSKAEQERVFTKAGAEAIRNGADPVRVVNARRGALTGAPGTRKALRVTSPDKLRLSSKVKLMPEQILRLAGDDQTRVIALLKKHGYIH